MTADTSTLPAVDGWLTLHKDGSFHIYRVNSASSLFRRRRESGSRLVDDAFRHINLAKIWMSSVKMGEFVQSVPTLVCQPAYK
jgi:hypothetical protein